MRIIHKRPSTNKIQPMRFLGRLEATRAPTRGKAKKGTKLNVSLMLLRVNQLPGDCADMARTDSTLPTTNTVIEKAASDHASLAEPWWLTSLIARRCSFAASVTTPLYSTTVSQA